MTTWEWKCRSCGYAFTNPIFRFISQCPECKTEYVKLAEAHGQKNIGTMPIYAMKQQSMNNEATRNSVLFAINTKANKIECYDYDFFNFIKKTFAEELEKHKVAVEFKEPQH